MADTQSYSLTDPNTNEDPFPFYKWMHATAPVYFDAKVDLFIVASYALIQKVALDTTNFSNEKAQLNQWNLRPGGMPARAMEILNTGTPQVPVLVTSDQPQHLRTRLLAQMAFRPQRVARMRAYLEKIVDALIDTFIHDGQVELVSQFAVKLPVYVISDQLGVPRSEHARVKLWSDATVGLRGLMGSDDEIVAYAEHMRDFQQYFGNLIARRRARGPAEDDVLDDLINAKTDTEVPLTDVELISIVQQLMVAGNESTTSAIAGAVSLIFQHDLSADALLSDTSMMLRFVEEALRLETPVQGTLRRALADTEIGGFAVPKDALVQLRHGAGNRDETAFENADRPSLDEKRSKHLTFGYGAHQCIGNSLAREEMFVCLTALLSRLPNLRLRPNANDFRHNRSIYIRGLQRLELEFGK